MLCAWIWPENPNLGYTPAVGTKLGDQQLR